jgi:hypothetical protein
MSKKDKPTNQAAGVRISAGPQEAISSDVTSRRSSPGSPATIDDFTRLLAELRGLLAEARLDSDIKDAIDANFKVVEAQVQKPEQKRGLIETKLNSIAGVLGSADKAAGVAEGLIEKGTALAATLGALAARLF